MKTYGKEVEEKQHYLPSGPLIKGYKEIDKGLITPNIQQLKE